MDKKELLEFLKDDEIKSALIGVISEAVCSVEINIKTDDEFTEGIISPPLITGYRFQLKNAQEQSEQSVPLQ